MIWVRGQSDDFDGWAEGLGDDRWRAARCLPRFEEVERELGVSHRPRCDMEIHDAGVRAFLSAAGEVGVRHTGHDDDHDDDHDNDHDDGHPWPLAGMLSSERQAGAGMLPVSIDENGLRASASVKFLTKDVLARPNLTVISDAVVDKLMFDADASACTGVRYTTSSSGANHDNARLKESGEVVLSSGAIGSPHILLKSGVGRRLPAVGQHLQDHCQIKAAFRTLVPSLNDRVNSTLGMVGMCSHFLRTQRGPITMAPTPAGVFCSAATTPTLLPPSRPDVQLLYGPWTSRSRNTVGALKLFRLLDPFSAAAMTSVQLRPHSRGSVTLAADGEPVIQPNFLSAPEDEAAAVANVRFMCQMAHSPAFSSVIDMARSVDSEASSLSSSDVGDNSREDTFTTLLQSGDPTSLQDERLLRYAKKNGTTIYHPVGTCRMGNDGGQKSVVDSDLRVHGLSGLSVADASVMPKIVSANTNATTMMIGLTAAGIIRERIRKRQQQQQQRRAYSSSPCRTALVRAALGFDFGTESVRAVLVDVNTGASCGAGVLPYAEGQITGGTLPGTSSPVPPGFVLQSSDDWWSSAEAACKEALASSGLDPGCVVGIGVDFTSCTPLPCKQDGTPLHTLDAFRTRPHAWPKLWKHQAAKEADEITSAILQEPDGGKWMLERYGGRIGAEWMHPKALQMFDEDRELFRETDVFVDAGDWFVHSLVRPASAEDGESTMKKTLVRSACQAGFKGCWVGPTVGFPSRDTLNRVRGGFGDAMEDKFHTVGRVVAPGTPAGARGLNEEAARRLGLYPGTPVGTSIIDAHAGVPGVGVGEANTLVCVMGTSGCYMLNANGDVKRVTGCLGNVPSGIQEGLTGLEMGQSAMGDLFAWLQRMTGRSLAELAAEAEKEAAKHQGQHRRPLVLDYFNGARSPYNDGALRGAIVQLGLDTTPGQLYLAVAEGLACGARQNVANFRQSGIRVDKVVAAGGLPNASPLLIQTMANALQEPVHVTDAQQSGGVGAAVFGAIAGGAFGSVKEAVAVMSAPALARGRIVHPDRSDGVQRFWDDLSARYAKVQEMELGLKGYGIQGRG
jgi:L-ribulokinase